MHHKVLLSQRSKAQSAMEYLMTDGWAILIIAVVLGALFELGVFSGTFFMPHVPPGSCHVFRPYGPGTVGSINLEGECQGALPQYVAEFDGNGFITSTGYYSNFPINYGCCYNSGGLQGITVLIWVNQYGAINHMGGLLFTNEWTQQISADTMNGLTLSGTSSNGGWIQDPTTLQSKVWYQVAITGENGVGEYLYVDGKQVANSLNSSFSVLTEPINKQLADIGADANGEEYSFSGMLSNVQIYNTSLSANDIYALYQEGIGGAPINLQNLVGWWPLNGNADDYSGNNYDGTATNVIYTTNWENGYTQP